MIYISESKEERNGGNNDNMIREVNLSITHARDINDGYFYYHDHTIKHAPFLYHMKLVVVIAIDEHSPLFFQYCFTMYWPYCSRLVFPQE